MSANPENITRTASAFHDKIYFPFTLGLILIHKLTPSVVSKHAINFLIYFFKKTRGLVSVYLEFDRKFVIEFQSLTQFRLRNKLINFESDKNKNKY